MKLISFGEIIWDVYPDKATLGGAPLNFAAHAALQGCDVKLVSCVGDDELGKKALGMVESLGVSTEYVGTSHNAPSGRCNVTLDEKFHPTYEIEKMSSYDLIEYPHVSNHQFDVIAFGTLALRYENNRAILERMIASGNYSEIFTDLNIRTPFYSVESIEFCFKHATIVKISDDDVQLIKELCYKNSSDERDFAIKLAKTHPQIKLVIITKGAKGAICYDCKKQEFISCPAVETEVISTVGAGDSFGATFLVNYMKTGDLSHSMKLASKVSAFVVSRMGAIPEDMKDLLKKEQLI